jgi:hypothetical protein
MKQDEPYQVLSGIAVLLILGGAFSLFVRLAGQPPEGSLFPLSLQAGAVCVLAGIGFWVLADLGRRLARIENRLGIVPKEEMSETEGAASGPAPGQSSAPGQVNKAETHFKAGPGPGVTHDGGAM